MAIDKYPRLQAFLAAGTDDRAFQFSQTRSIYRLRAGRVLSQCNPEQLF